MTTPDQLRQIARQAQAATRELEKAVSRGAIDRVQSALDAGAVPEWGTYPNKNGSATGSVVGRCLKHRNLVLLKLLLDAGAPVGGDRGASVVKTAVQAKFPEALALLAPLFTPTDKEWNEALEGGLAYFKALDDVHHLDRTRPLDIAPQAFPVTFHARDADTLRYLAQTGADLLATACVGPNAWTASQWCIQRSAGLEDERGDIIQQTFGASSQELGLELMGEGNPLPLLYVFKAHGETFTKVHLAMACNKGYPDVLRYLLSQEPSLRIDAKKDDGTYEMDGRLKNRPKLFQALLAEQRALDLERSTAHATGAQARPRI